MNMILEGKVAAITGAASGIGLATAETMMAAGAKVVVIDTDEKALSALSKKYGNALIPLATNLLDPKNCASILNRILDKVDKIDIFHANAGLYIGGEFIDADSEAIDNMLNLNINVVMKNIHSILPHMIEKGVGDIIVTSSLAGHYPTSWEPIYASSKWAINCFVQTLRRQVFKHGIRVGSVSPGPVVTALINSWPEDKLKEAKQAGSIIEASEIADAIMYMLSRPRNVTIRDMVIIPSNFDL